MPRLFIKIFLSVLLTVLLTFTIGMVIAFWLIPPMSFDETTAPNAASQPGAHRLSDPHHKRLAAILSLQSRLIAEKMRNAGPDAAVAEVDNLADAWRIHAYILDSQGAELLNRETPPRIRLLANRIAQREGPLLRTEGDILIWGERILSPNGEAYVLVAETSDAPSPPRPPFARILALRLTPIALGLGLVCYLLARYIASPIVRMRTALRRFADGDMEQRVGESIGKRRDEIGDLSREFDHMAERIATLLEAERRLLQDISHELRSPLARQRVALELIRRKNPTGVSAELDRAELEAEKLDELIAELLELTRVESDSDEAERHQHDIATLVHEVIENAEFEAIHNGRNVRLMCGEPYSLPVIPKLIKRAVENIVRNALRHTPEGTTIEVSLQLNATHGLIQIRDHGPGVPDAELTDIFRPFYRVSHARERQAGGVGLGLAIAARAVHLHDGDIAASNHPKGGLIVQIQIPRPTPAP